MNIAAVSEALTLAVKSGTDPELVYQAIRGGLAGATVMDAKALMMAHNFKPGFRIELHIKDLNNALNAAHVVSAPVPFTSQVMQIIEATMQEFITLRNRMSVPKLRMGTWYLGENYL